MLRKVIVSNQGRKGLCEGGGSCLKYLKREWKGKDGRENKDFKKGDKLGQGMGALKVGAGTPLQIIS